jgi:hypothetical protein
MVISNDYKLNKQHYIFYLNNFLYHNYNGTEIKIPETWRIITYYQTTTLSAEEQKAQEEKRQAAALELQKKFNICKALGFTSTLRQLMQNHDLYAPDVYKAIDMDRRLFSKIINTEDYRPTKKTVLLIAMGMKLNLEEAQGLLLSAGYAFSPSFVTDLIVQYCINKHIYNLFDVDDLLEHYEQPSLRYNSAL